MNRTGLLAVALLVAGVAVAQDRKADDKAAKAELKPEGSWKTSSAEMGGQELKPRAIRRVRSEGG
jgi:hypothetical protein